MFSGNKTIDCLIISHRPVLPDKLVGFAFFTSGCCAVKSTYSNGNSNQKVEPFPNWLSVLIFPLIPRTNCWLVVLNPDLFHQAYECYPDWLWAKDSHIFSIWSSAMPSSVSVTSILIPGLICLSVNFTSSSGVNLRHWQLGWVGLVWSFVGYPTTHLTS